MRILVLASWLLLGCGATNSPPTEGSVMVPAPPSASASASAAAVGLPQGVEARLGCTEITSADVDRELAALQRLSKDPVTREMVRDELIHGVVAADYARSQDIVVDAKDVDVMLERLAKENTLTVEQLLAEVRATGVDEAYYRRSLRDQMLQMKVRMRLSPDEKDTPTLIKKSDIELERLRAQLAARRTYRTPSGCSETPPE